MRSKTKSRHKAHPKVSLKIKSHQRRTNHVIALIANKRLSVLPTKVLLQLQKRSKVGDPIELQGEVWSIAKVWANLPVLQKEIKKLKKRKANLRSLKKTKNEKNLAKSLRRARNVASIAIAIARTLAPTPVTHRNGHLTIKTLIMDLLRKSVMGVITGKVAVRNYMTRIIRLTTHWTLTI